MIYAQIKNGIVQNTIVLNDTSLISHFSQGFDSMIDITNIQHYPSPGDLYDGTNFSPAPGPSAQIVVEGEIQAAIDGFNSIMISYAAQNVLLGITQAGKTQLIADTLSPVLQYGQTGSLYAAISALQAITPTSQMAPYLTSAIIASLIAQAEALLASL